MCTPSSLFTCFPCKVPCVYGVYHTAQRNNNPFMDPPYVHHTTQVPLIQERAVFYREVFSGLCCASSLPQPLFIDLPLPTLGDDRLLEPNIALSTRRISPLGFVLCIFSPSTLFRPTSPSPHLEDDRLLRCKHRSLHTPYLSLHCFSSDCDPVYGAARFRICTTAALRTHASTYIHTPTRTCTHANRAPTRTHAPNVHVRKHNNTSL